MRNRVSQCLRFLFSVLALCGTTTIIFPANLFSQTGGVEKNPTAPESQIEKSKVSFEENRGQFDPQVRYLARTAGGEIFLTGDEMVYVLPLTETRRHGDAGTRRGETDVDAEDIAASQAFALRMKFVGANSASTFAGESPQEKRTNYFKGDEANWRTDIPNFSDVRYENVYNGIGMIWRGRENGAVQYDFLVAPNADSGQIALEFDGADEIEIDADGNLLIHTAAGIIKQAKPFSYQESGGVKQEIESRFCRMKASSSPFASA